MAAPIAKYNLTDLDGMLLLQIGLVSIGTLHGSACASVAQLLPMRF